MKLLNLLKRLSGLPAQGRPPKPLKKNLRNEVDLLNQKENSPSFRIPAEEGYRPDLDKNFRSKMESNVYRYLVECHPKLARVEYEPHLFSERDGLPKGFYYLPDFRCTTHDGYQFYIEVKGVMDKRSLKAFATMKEYRSDIDLRIIDVGLYQRIKKRYAKQTKGWEY